VYCKAISANAAKIYSPVEVVLTDSRSMVQHLTGLSVI